MARSKQSHSRLQLGDLPGRLKGRHGAYGLLQTLSNGSLDGRSTEAIRIKAIVRALAADQGAPFEELSAPRRLLTESTAVVATVIHMMASWALQHGMVGEDGQLVSLLRSDFAAFANLLRKNLVTLGLERRIKEAAIDLDAYVEAKYGPGGGLGDDAPGESP